ncbi:hypothetical protein T484DRAFT_1955334 [Baffinella frigidus]|nr:hypothetical protein T484DRAFT_1955334 [Cryptophyta sp. CCMP2293]
MSVLSAVSCLCACNAGSQPPSRHLTSSPSRHLTSPHSRHRASHPWRHRTSPRVSSAFALVSLSVCMQCRHVRPTPEAH